MGKGRCAIVTLGCKVNQFESEAIAEAMAGEGWEVVPFGPGIDCTGLPAPCPNSRACR